MKRLQSPKVCAALIMIAWLATLTSYWGMEVARGKAIGGDASCSGEDLEGKAVQLEMVSKADDEVLKTLIGNEGKAPCIRGRLAKVIAADYLFIPSYSALTLAFFLFVRSLRAGQPSLQNLLVALGVLLALTMAIGDIVENGHLLQLIKLAGQESLPQIDAEFLSDLKTAANVKMGALALASLILGALWPSRSRWVLALRLFGFAAAALFAASMVLDLRKEMLDIFDFQIRDWNAATDGMIAFAAFTLTALIHAIATMADREQYSVALAAGAPKP